MPDSRNKLYFGDNLAILREHVSDESVDLVYLDPPFNSAANYNVLFRENSGEGSAAQITAFDDTWHWGAESESMYHELVTESSQRIAVLIQAFRAFLGENDMMAYLTMMAPRLLELRRTLRDTGSLYLHCDSTASHYLKLLLDAVFGPINYRNEIIWKRFSSKNDPNRYGRNHDTIFFYSRGAKFVWNPQYGPFEENYVDENYRYVEEETGRRYRLSDLTANKPGGDVDYEWHGMRPYKGRHWAFSRDNMNRFHAEGRIVFRKTGMPVYKRYLDEQPGVPLQDIWTDIKLSAGSRERLGYPTQKPEALLERIPYDVVGDPKDAASAAELAQVDRYQFQWWAVGLVGGRPAQDKKKGADSGIDGYIFFFDDKSGKARKIIIQVKSGHVKVGDIRDLKGVLERECAEIGAFISLESPTRPMKEEALRAGFYLSPFVPPHKFPKLQLLTIGDILSGKDLLYPRMSLGTFTKAERKVKGQSQDKLFE